MGPSNRENPTIRLQRYKNNSEFTIRRPAFCTSRIPHAPHARHRTASSGNLRQPAARRQRKSAPKFRFSFSCKKLFIPTVAERRRRRHPPGRKLGESRRLAPKTPHGQARAAFSTAQPRPFFFPIFRKAERLYALAVSPTLRGRTLRSTSR